MTKIIVSINPDGTAREVGAAKPKYNKWEHSYVEWSLKMEVWEEKQAQLRTFDIEFETCTCATHEEVGICVTNCVYNRAEFLFNAKTYPAEITQEYPEPVEGIHGKCRILRGKVLLNYSKCSFITRFKAKSKVKIQ